MMRIRAPRVLAAVLLGAAGTAPLLAQPSLGSHRFWDLDYTLCRWNDPGLDEPSRTADLRAFNGLREREQRSIVAYCSSCSRLDELAGGAFDLKALFKGTYSQELTLEASEPICSQARLRAVSHEPQQGVTPFECRSGTDGVDTLILRNPILDDEVHHVIVAIPSSPNLTFKPWPRLDESGIEDEGAVAVQWANSTTSYVENKFRLRYRLVGCTQKEFDTFLPRQAPAPKPLQLNVRILGAEDADRLARARDQLVYAQHVLLKNRVPLRLELTSEIGFAGDVPKSCEEVRALRPRQEPCRANGKALYCSEPDIVNVYMSAGAEADAYCGHDERGESLRAVTLDSHAAIDVLAHELGHAAGLSSSAGEVHANFCPAGESLMSQVRSLVGRAFDDPFGLVDAPCSFGADNLMWSRSTETQSILRDRLTVGQIARIEMRMRAINSPQAVDSNCRPFDSARAAGCPEIWLDSVRAPETPPSGAPRGDP
jgi:hypothetical protein